MGRPRLGRGGNKGGAAARRRCIGAASARFLTCLVNCFSSNQAVSDNPSGQPQEKFLVNRIFFYSVKIDPFCSVSRWGWEVSNFGAFGLYPPPLPRKRGAPLLTSMFVVPFGPLLGPFWVPFGPLLGPFWVLFRECSLGIPLPTALARGGG